MSIKILEEEIVILRDLFRHPAGVEAAELIEKKFVNVLGFDADPYIHAFNSGQRGLALLLCACAKADKKVVGAEQVDPTDPENTTN